METLLKEDSSVIFVPLLQKQSRKAWSFRQVFNLWMNMKITTKLFSLLKLTLQ